MALVWDEERAARCPSCGTWDWEWDENPDAWHADTWRCHGCERRDQLRRSLDQGSMQGHDGLQIRMFRTPRER